MDFEQFKIAFCHTMLKSRKISRKTFSYEKFIYCNINIRNFLFFQFLNNRKSLFNDQNQKEIIKRLFENYQRQIRHKVWWVKSIWFLICTLSKIKKNNNSKLKYEKKTTYTARRLRMIIWIFSLMCESCEELFLIDEIVLVVQ